MQMGNLTVTGSEEPVAAKREKPRKRKPQQTANALKAALKHFAVKAGELAISGQPVKEIARQFGLPLYVYQRETLVKRHKALRKHLPENLKIYYAMKANPFLPLVRLLGKMYDGIDVASAGEMRLALNAGQSACNMSFTGPGKSTDELHFAISKGIGTISVESRRELELIIRICTELKVRQKILIRVNPDFKLARSGMKMGGGPQQFGIDSEQVPEVIDRVTDEAAIEFAGVHLFTGSQILSADAITDAFAKIIEYLMALRARSGTPILEANLGGGFGIPYFAKDEPLDIAATGSGLAALLSQAQAVLPETRFRIELGRYIVGECGVYLCEVLYRKQSRGEVFLVTNGGLHHHLAASGNFGQKMVHRPMPVAVANRIGPATERVNLVGPLCTPLDTFGSQLQLAAAREGDVIAVFNSGAYGFSASPLGFLSHEPPGEVLL